MPNPWERRPDEGNAAWAAFATYRDLPIDKRTLKAATAATGRKPASHRQLELWSSKYDWVARAASWDAYLDRRGLEARAKRHEEIRRRQAELGRALQGVAAQGLKALSGKAGALRGSEVAALAKAGFEVERVAEGLPDNIGEIQGDAARPIVVVKREIPPIEGAEGKRDS